MQADEISRPEDRRGPAPAGPFPPFRYLGVVLDPAALRYSPHPDIIHPSVIEARPPWEHPLARYYLYYAPHDSPGGICLALADTPEGPWREYGSNPLILRDWPPHYQVSHVSSPHAVWNPEEEKVFLYYHGNNDTTRFATSRDGIHFDYGGLAVNTAMFEPGLKEASYARVFRHTAPDGKGPYVMLVMGNRSGTRCIYLAWSRDGRQWEPQREAFIAPPPGNSQMGPGSLVSWHGRLYLVCFANRADAPEYRPVSDLHLYEVSPGLDRAAHLGILMPHDAAGAGNARINDPCLLRTPDRLYLFVNVGQRLRQQIGLAVADLPA